MYENWKQVLRWKLLVYIKTKMTFKLLQTHKLACGAKISDIR